MADTTKSIIRLSQYDLLRTNITPGNYYVTTDYNNRVLYRDTTDGKRIIVNAIQLTTEKQRTYEQFQKTNGQLYYVWESNYLYVWNNRWEIVKGDPNYPDSLQYLGGTIYGVGDYSYDDVKGNGILGDGSVVVRDNNRIIKAQIYIDSTNDNLVISSFLGGGIKLLPNGNMEDTGALFLNPTTLLEDNEHATSNGLGVHYNSFENRNGELYVSYDKEHISSDPNQNQNLEHKYLVWHEGNLDATPLIEGWYLLKEIDNSSERKGYTKLENTKESNGFSAKSKNQELNANVEFATHAFNDDGSYILGEFTGTDATSPLEDNAGIYIVRDPVTREIQIHLRKGKDRPTTAESLSDSDQLLTKGEIANLMNQNIYNAVQLRLSGNEEYYKIYESDLKSVLADGFILSVTFSKDTTAENIYLSIADGPNEVIDLNKDSNKKQRPIGFKAGSIYQLIRTGNKWLVINPQMRANNQENGYGTIRVTGDSSDVSSFNIVTNPIVDLNTVQFTYNGEYSFISEISTALNFPEEEMQNATDKEMQYRLDVGSTAGRGTSINMDDNSVEQILTNVDLGKKYIRFLNRDWYYRGEYEQGDLDANGREIASNIKVRQKRILKVNPGMTYKFRHIGLSTTVQMKVIRLSKEGVINETNFMNVSSNGVTVRMDNNTEYIRAVYQYEDGGSALSPTLLQDCQLMITGSGYTTWKKIYDENEKLDEEKTNKENIKLPAKDWTLNNSTHKFEQTFYRWYVTENTQVDGILDVDNQSKIETSHIESFNYGFKVVSLSKPVSDIDMMVTYTETKEV